MTRDGGDGLALRIEGAGREPRRVLLDRDRLTVGRSPRANLTLDDPFASRLHAELRVESGACWVTDLGSSNGTFVGGSRVVGPVALAPGERIRIGETELVLEPGDGAGSPPTPAASPTAGAAAADATGARPRTAEIADVLASVERAAGAPADRLLGAPSRDLFAVISKVGLALLSPLSLEDVLRRILELVFDGIPAERALLELQEPAGGGSALRVASSRTGGRLDPGEISLSRGVREQALGARQSVLTTDAQVDERFRHRESIILSGIRSIMAVPLLAGDRLLGLVYVDSPLEVRPFTRDDLQLLTTIASVAAVKVENTLLLEERIEADRLREQLSKARDIQVRLLPARPPAIPGYDIGGVSFPTFAVGGDYFDFIPRGRELVVALGDVSGKGLDAALLMSSLHAAVRAQAGSAEAAPGAMIDRVNAYLCQAFPFNKFATLFCGILDPARHTFAFANAGHTPALLVRPGGEVVELPATGPPAGMVDGQVYETRAQELGPGDVLTLYSDGASEAQSQGGELLGPEGLTEILRDCRELTASATLDRIDAALLEYTGGAELDDDMTLVVVKRVE
ncbi:MAG TPA: SpoIIE family protein phosphatase [Thermoanaerobaculia bacterium]|nr:SpoIIE family protein phosphatase [Thermoanaerobaculia bacterium]